MESPFALVVIFSLILIAKTVDARPDPGEYWHNVMKDEPMPEAIQGLVHKSSVSPLSDKKTNCHTSTEAKNSGQFVEDSPRNKPFVQDFEPRPNISAYDDDEKLTEDNKSFVKDFEPRPNVLVYHDDAGLKGEKPFVNDFEPRPNVSVYQG